MVLILGRLTGWLQEKDKNSASSQIFWLLKDCEEKSSESKQLEEAKDVTVAQPLYGAPELTNDGADSNEESVNAAPKPKVELKVKGVEGFASAIELNTTDPSVDEKKETVTKDINILESIIDGIATEDSSPGDGPGTQGQVIVTESSSSPQVEGSSSVEGDLQESEIKVEDLKRSNGTTKDGQYAVFGYVVENQGLLAHLQVGDVIESMRVISGIDNLVNPSYRI